FASRTLTALAPKVLCTPSPLPTTSTSTTTHGPTTTSTSTLPSADDALNCQRAIEAGGMSYARQTLDFIESCADPSQPFSLSSCLSAAGGHSVLDSLRGQWGTDTAGPCAGVDVRTTLGYADQCGAAPSSCQFASPVLDAAGNNNDVLDCLA